MKISVYVKRAIRSDQVSSSYEHEKPSSALQTPTMQQQDKEKDCEVPAQLTHDKS